MPFIPRLIFHKEEVEKLFKPDDCRITGGKNNNETSVATTIRDDDEDPRTVSNNTDYTQEQHEADSDLEAQLSQDDTLSSTISTGASQRNIQAVQATMEEASAQFVKLPHRASHNRRHLFLLLSYLLLGSAFCHMWIFGLPLKSINLGLEANRVFLYGIMTYVEFVSLVPWIETCNYAVPEAKIPISVRIWAVVVGLTAQKVVDAFVAEGWWKSGAEPMFPIPFSSISTQAVAIPTALVALFLFCWRRRVEISSAQWIRCSLILLTYMLTIAIAGAWGALVTFLNGTKFQVLGFLPLVLLRFVCKILFAARVSTKLNPNRWIMLGLVVDIIFARIQVIILPFINHWTILLFGFVASCGNLVWRHYSGVDRLQLAMKYFCGRNKSVTETLGEKFEVPSLTEHPLAAPVRKLVRAPVGALALAPLPAIHETSMRLVRTESIRKHWEKWATRETVLESIVGTGDDEEGQVDWEGPYDSSLTLESSSTGTDGQSSAQGGASVEQVEVVVETGEGQPVRKRVTIAEEVKMVEDSPLEAKLVSEAVKTVSFEVPGVDSGDYQEDSINSLVDSEASSETSSGLSDTEIELAPVRSTEPIEEVEWVQRQLFHVVDSIGSEALQLIIFIQHLLSLWSGRSLPVKDHLNVSLAISSDQWHQAWVFGLISVFGNIIIIGLMSIFYPRIEKLGDDRKLTMSRVIPYIFRNNFWFFFLWLVATGAYVCAAMVNHFGTDFTMQFQWLNCRSPGEMIWPGCI